MAALIYRTGRPFDLEEGPCWRVAAIRRGDGALLVLLVVHHILTDEWSIDRLADDLRAGAMALHRGEAPAAPDAGPNFADLAVWERERRADGGFRAQRDWWVRRLAPPPEAALGSKPPEIRARSVETFHIGPGTWRAVLGQAETARATPFTVLLGCFALAITRRAGAARTLVCTNHARRLRPETQGMIGPLTDLLIVPVEIDKPDLAGAVQAARDSWRACLDRLDVPFAEVLAAVEREHGVTPSALAPYFFMFHEQAASAEEVRLGPGYLATAHHDFDLVLNLVGGEGGIEGELAIAQDRAGEHAGLAAAFVAILDAIAATCAA